MEHRSPLIDEVGQKKFHFHSTFQQIERHKAYDLAQRLTFFVIGLEAVVCGYILLNAKTLINVNGLEWLFAVLSVAVIAGLTWRVLYNETFHLRSHSEIESRWYQPCFKIQLWAYWLYVLFSTAALIAILIIGFIYLKSLKAHSTTEPKTKTAFPVLIQAPAIIAKNTGNELNVSFGPSALLDRFTM